MASRSSSSISCSTVCRCRFRACRFIPSRSTCPRRCSATCRVRTVCRRPRALRPLPATTPRQLRVAAAAPIPRGATRPCRQAARRMTWRTMWRRSRWTSRELAVPRRKLRALARAASLGTWCASCARSRATPARAAACSSLSRAAGHTSTASPGRPRLSRRWPATSQGFTPCCSARARSAAPTAASPVPRSAAMSTAASAPSTCRAWGPPARSSWPTGASTARSTAPSRRRRAARSSTSSRSPTGGCGCSRASGARPRTGLTGTGSASAR
mmetsp:Transcript_17682/g.56557  ORF Transcript_17682/g.56557 Transcript_17682/m.56557 type:complete len:270 (-) Transcript_17682:454-1263(-)